MQLRILPLLAGLLTAATFAHAQDNIVLRNGDEIPAKVLEVNQTDLRYRKAANPDGPIYTAPLRDVFFIKYANGTKDIINGATIATPTAQTTPTPTTPTLLALSQLRYHSRWFNRHFSDSTGRRLSTPEVALALRQQPDALLAFKQGQSLRTWSLVTAGAGLAAIGVGAGLAIDGRFGNGDRAGHDGRFDDDFDQNGRGDGRRSRVAGAALAGGGVLLGLTSLWLDHRATVQFRRAADRYNGRTPVSMQFGPATRELGMGVKLTF
jgi:hypothetical protein